MKYDVDTQVVLTCTYAYLEPFCEHFSGFELK